MARTTAGRVEKLLGVNYDGRTDVQQFIDSATVVVDRVVTCAAAKGVTLSVAEQELVERWLSCHNYAVMDQITSNDSNEGASGSYQGQTGMYLEGTKYGQYAMNLDYSGCLTAISKRQTAGSMYLGRTRVDSTTPEQR